MKKNNKIVVFTSLVLLIVLICSFSIYFFVKTQKKNIDNKNKEKAELNQDLNNETDENVPNDLTVGWIVYNNNEYGFSFKHPNLDDKYGVEVTLAGPATGNVIFSKTYVDKNTVTEGSGSPFVGMAFYIVETQDDLNQYITNEKSKLIELSELVDSPINLDLAVAKQVTIGSQNGYLLSNYCWDGIERYYIQMPKSKNILVISLGTEKPTNYSYDTILSSFNFATK